MRQNRRGRNRGMRKGLGAKGFDNGGEVRVRGNVHQLLERYLQLARDAGSAGDRIAAENYLQHAEHYYRVINENGMNNRPRFNGRELSVAAINVQNVTPGLSAAIYGNGQMADGNETHPHANGEPAINGNGLAHEHPVVEEAPQAEMQEEPQEEISAPPVESKRRAPRGRPRRARIAKEETD